MISRSFAALLAAITLLVAAPARAQDHSRHSMPGHAMPAASSVSMPAAAPEMPAMRILSPLGRYPMARDASGTSWQPNTTTMGGLHAHGDPWALMLHGFVNVVYDHQGGPRGDVQTITQSMLMGMAQRPLGPGTLGLRAMMSLDPTTGKRGYPLLFQTGETADGEHHLVDRQHPHDFLMELSGSYALPWGDDGSVFLYGGLPGEPALGPPAFMHRGSAIRNPEAPLSHHWLDSTHITFGVVTLGTSRGPVKLEGSWFNGREPDQYRWNIETRKLDSWSARVSFNPVPQLSMQLSHGRLKSPEQLEPDTRVRRTTASATLQLRPAGIDWGTTLAWGQNRKIEPEGRRTLPAWLLESSATAGRHTLFGRFERIRNDELFQHDDPLDGQTFRVSKFELGYVFDVVKAGPATWGLGVSAATFAIPKALEASYGKNPRSVMLFLQGRI